MKAYKKLITLQNIITKYFVMEQEITFDNLPKAVSQLNKKLETIEQLILSKEDNSKSDLEKLLTIQEAAEMLNLTIPTIYSKVSKGELPVMKQGKRLYFSNIELMEYVKAGKRRSNSEIEAEANAYLSKERMGGEDE